MLIRKKAMANLRLRKSTIIIFLILLVAATAIVTASFVNFQNQNQNSNPPTISTGTSNTQSDPDVLPEYGLGGGLIALFACIAAFIFFKIEKPNSKKTLI